MAGQHVVKPNASDDRPEIVADLGDQAVAWLVLLRSGRATDAEHAAFTAWRRGSAAHETAAREAEEMWRDIGKTSAAAAFAAGREGEGRRFSAKPTRLIGRRAVLTGAVAASAALAVVGTASVVPVAGVFADHVTRVGERRQIWLPDGSVASLNTASALSLAYAESRRQVTLHAGEALFEVARDPARPFVIAAAGGEIEALGTVFAVRHEGPRLRILVCEGRVEVRAGSTARTLTAGQQAAVTADSGVTEPQGADTAAATAWVRGKLIFNRRPLGEVVAEIERYQLGRIVVTDHRLRSLEVTGVFDLDDAAGLLRTLQQTLGVRVVRLPLLTLIG